MALRKRVVFLLVLEERIHTADLEFHVDLAGETLLHFREKKEIVLACVHGASHCRKEVGILHFDRVLFIELERADKSLLEFCEEMQGAAQERDVAAYGFAAGKAAYGLVDDGLENGRRKIFLGGAFVDQGLDVGLGKNAASGRDRIKGCVIPGIFVQSCSVCLQKGSHLVDKGTCAAGADTVHSLFDIPVFKIDDLGVLAAQLDRNVCLGRDLLECG